MCSELKQGRIQWIDICRGIGILLVLLGHVNPPFKGIIYGFHIPLFFLISGYLYRQERKEQPFPQVCRLYAKRYLSPYFILCGINLLLELGGVLALRRQSGWTGMIKKYLIGILYARGTVEWMPNCSPLWFLPCMFVGLLLLWLVFRFRNFRMQALAVFLMGTISYTLFLCKAPKLFWNIDTALMSVVFLYIGWWMGKKNIIPHLCQSWRKEVLWCLCLGLLGTAAVCLNGAVDFDNNEYGNLLFMLAGALCGSVVVMCCAYSLQGWKGRLSMQKFFTYLGNHTLFLMGFDYFSNTVARQLLWSITGKFELDWVVIMILKVMILLIGLQAWSLVLRFIPNKKVQKLLSF